MQNALASEAAIANCADSNPISTVYTVEIRRPGRGSRPIASRVVKYRISERPICKDSSSRTSRWAAAVRLASVAST